ncbi:MAG: carboxypeptidase-like regulatory domain-containing protein, partial [Tannerella sp.]|nr:carboxypeptidase-like regulatory domain-containing protein [Tannerella sp.]
MKIFKRRYNIPAQSSELFVIMMISTVLLICVFSQAGAVELYSQGVKVTVDAERTMLSDVLDKDVVYTILNGHTILQQQPRHITGIVTDSNDEAIIGANVVEKGSTNGTVTDVD